MELQEMFGMENTIPEQSVYEQIKGYLKDAAASVGANEENISLYEAKGYSSVLYKKTLIFRMKFRKKSHYIEIPLAQSDIISQYPELEAKRTSTEYLRVDISANELMQQESLIKQLVQNTLMRIPKEWDCCSRYRECSNVKSCVHPDKDFALGCGYRKILASGKIYYGENRNV